MILWQLQRLFPNSILIPTMWHLWIWFPNICFWQLLVSCLNFYLTLKLRLRLSFPLTMTPLNILFQHLLWSYLTAFLLTDISSAVAPSIFSPPPTPPDALLLPKPSCIESSRTNFQILIRTLLRIFILWELLSLLSFWTLT